MKLCLWKPMQRFHLLRDRQSGNGSGRKLPISCLGNKLIQTRESTSQSLTLEIPLTLREGIPKALKDASPIVWCLRVQT